MGLGGSMRQFSQPAAAAIAPPPVYGSAPSAKPVDMSQQASAMTPGRNPNGSPRGLAGSMVGNTSTTAQNPNIAASMTPPRNYQSRGSGGVGALVGQMGAPQFNGGVATGGGAGQPNPYAQQGQGGSLAEIQAEMARRNVGVQLNADPANSALAGYMMG